MPELPLDVVCNNILSRLPVKSLIRFNSVSNQWRSFLKSRVFANMHLNRVRNDYHQNHHNFLKIYRERVPCEFSTIDCETLEVGVSRPFPFKVTGGRIWVESSCNGLVFLYLMNDNYMISDLIIWNPLTSDYKMLAKSDINNKLYHIWWGTKFELCCNSCDEDYKLVCVTFDHDVYIYSLKTDSWRKVNSLDACQFTPDLISYGLVRSACLNENIYLLEMLRSTYVITKFDTKTEKFTKIATPITGNEKWYGLMVHEHCIYLLVESYTCYNSPIDIWMMNRDGDWMRISTFKDNLYDTSLRPLHLMRDGTWLMKSGSTGNLCKVKGHKRKTCKDTLNDIEEAGRYIQTFLSPNQYMN